MKVHLMFRDRDFDIQASPCFGKDTLIVDLGLELILSSMAQGDETVYAVCSAVLFHPLQSTESIRYRQDNLQDAFRNPDVVRELYDITVETERRRRSSWYWLSSNYLSGTFSSAVGLLKIYMEMLARLRGVADSKLASFRSEGFRNLLTMIQRELSDEYLTEVNTLLNDLGTSDAVLISAKLGNYLQGVDYVLRRKDRRGFWRGWAFTPSWTMAPRDDAAATDLQKRRERAINEVTNALAQAAEHLERFFILMKHELAFYVGCLNLANNLRTLGMPVCIPDVLPIERQDRSWRGLYDVSLALSKGAAVIGNELDTACKQLYIITGANQGGKTTFLRSIGQAQLMAQCGMFVGAESFSVPIRHGVFTHFKKEEDAAMKSGKLDEELSRMSELVDHLRPGSLVLLNESFSATNEREGSEICRQITKALMDNGVEVFSVTHLYTYASSFMNDPNTQFLRAQHLENGERTFKIIPGEPLQTAFGEDLYRKIFAVSC